MRKKKYKISKNPFSTLDHITHELLDLIVDLPVQLNPHKFNNSPINRKFTFYYFTVTIYYILDFWKEILLAGLLLLLLNNNVRRVLIMLVITSVTIEILIEFKKMYLLKILRIGQTGKIR